MTVSFCQRKINYNINATNIIGNVKGQLTNTSKDLTLKLK